MDNTRFWWASDTPPTPGGFSIGGSIRFKGEGSQIRRANFDADHTAFTMSFWVKIGIEPTHNELTRNAWTWTGGQSSNKHLYWEESTQVFQRDEGQPGTFDLSTNKYRDPSAWYHIVCTNAAFYVNGETIATGNFWNDTSSNDLFIIGGSGDAGNRHFDWEGLQAAWYFIDGQTLDPTSFGRYDDAGRWLPKPYEGTFGTDGFYLDFIPENVSFNGTNWIIEDQSGNNNDFTVPNTDSDTDVSDPQNPNYDLLLDSPTQNYSTLNPIQAGRSSNPISPDLEWVNMQKIIGANPMNGTSSTQYWAVDDHVYVELDVKNFPSNTMFGFTVNPQATWQADYPAVNDLGHGYYVWDGTSFTMEYPKSTNPIDAVGTLANLTWTPNATISSNVTQGWEWDGPNRRIKYYEDGVLVSTSSQWPDDPDMKVVSFGFDFNVSPSSPYDINFGQQPYRGGIPSGLTQNTAGVASPNAAAAQVTNPSDAFRVLTNTGANILNTAKGVLSSGSSWNPAIDTGFTNGLWWIKDMDNANVHQLVDSVTNAVYGTDKASITPSATNGDGGGFLNYAAPSGNSVAWCWNYDAADPQKYGFAIKHYTGTGEGGSQPHNLGALPDMIIIGAEDEQEATTAGLVVYNRRGTSAITYSRTSDPQSLQNPDDTSVGGVKTASETTLTYSSSNTGSGAYSGCNELGSEYTMYLWNAIPGFSAFGEYTGNANADGPFIYLGFRPALFMWKSVSSNQPWCLVDSTRSPANPAQETLYTDDKQAQDQGVQIDFVANGVKLRDSGSLVNIANQQFVYAAFAENPFGGNNVPPANAR